MNHCKRYIALVCAALLLSVCAAFAQKAADFWTDGKGTITGYVGSALNVVIPSVINGEKITAIGKDAFEKGVSTGLRTDTSQTDAYGRRIVSIYEGYTPLASVTIPDGVTTIGDGAFRYNKLTSVKIPDSVTEIDAYAFYDSGLASVVLGKGVASIGREAFNGNNLTSVTIPDSVTTIGESAFAGNELTSVTIQGGITTIGNKAFESNKLTSVTMQDGVISIGNHAFNNNKLASVTIPDSVTFIDYSAFSGNPLTRVTIGSYVDMRDNIGANNFAQAYKDNNEQGGTYALQNGKWVKQ